MAGDASRTTPSPDAHGTTPSTGWLSSSGAIDHGRFTPGTLLGGRYRIVGRLGRGGMGEVYRADDLKLGQPVALKFLPPDVDRDPARLTQLHTEVRMARQVSHPNVCRVYDIDEVDGHTFLSMEYVDGEDLGSLLRRFGRFSVDRALELARQICAGLAAAHERGVVHRDFKPANVMLDGSGKVRITDFGLAGAAGETLRAGTPAYMAPEQLAGGEVTAQSDIYSLGLVLYELFTGRRALDARSLAELVRKREEGGIAPPSSIVAELEPAIDRAILRCLDREPSGRPASALAVAAALPGGDPLAAALAAGETPSPEMVAAAGSTSALGAVPALAALAATLILLVAVAAMADRLSVTSLVPMNKPPAVLVDGAMQIAGALGYIDAPSGRAWGFSTAGDYLNYARTHPDALQHARLRTGRPPALVFWYRSSPQPLVPSGSNTSISYTDPPYTVPGMLAMQLDTAGRLLDLAAVPPQVEDTPPSSPGAQPWDALFAAADLDRRLFAPVTPSWTPRAYSDERAAWLGPAPGWPDVQLRIEAAAYRGRPVSFRTIWPWTVPMRPDLAAPQGSQRWLQLIATALALGVLLGAVLVARHNYRQGRGDRRGARRLAATVFAATLAAIELGGAHVPLLSVEMSRFFDAVGSALWAAGTIWVLYIALEPYVRRFWPSTLISWSRFMSGQFMDSQVGRDVLIGCLVALAIEAMERAVLIALPSFGYPTQPPVSTRISDLEGVRQLMASGGQFLFNALFNALWVIFGLVILRLFFRRVWLTSLVAILMFLLATQSSLTNIAPWWVVLGTATISLSLILVIVLRLGLLATTVFFVVNFGIGQAVLTLDPGNWFFVTSLWTLAGAALVAGYGFYAARGGEPLFGVRVLD